MFAKVFGQIFDSSIAEDYNCRRMFMDLLVLSDPTGAVDMTHEAISRRTNVPLEEVVKYITELCQPDAKSRSAMEEGKRLIPLDSNRDWGWKIVNYGYYRKIKNQEALREYFREKQREHRAKKKCVKDKGLTELDEVGQPLTSSHTPSSSVSKKKADKEEQVVQYCISLGLTQDDGSWFWDKCEGNGWKNGGKSIVDWKSTVSSWKRIGTVFPSQKNGQNGDKRRQMSAFEIDKRKQAISDEINKIFRSNGGRRVEGDGIDDLKNRRDELQKSLTQ